MKGQYKRQGNKPKQQNNILKGRNEKVYNYKLK
jgi:hypothetical protein